MKALTRFNEDKELHDCKIGTASDVSAGHILRLSLKIVKSNPAYVAAEARCCSRSYVVCREPGRSRRCARLPATAGHVQAVLIATEPLHAGARNAK